MTQLKLNGHAATNGHSHKDTILSRPRPQETYFLTSVNTESFYGKLRNLYSNQVLKTQLDQLKKQGSYDAFKLGWHPAYDVRRLTGAKTRVDGIPPSLFWESDVGKWWVQVILCRADERRIEGACYFLSSPDAKSCSHAAEFDAAIQELVDMIEKAQQPDGYLDIYFTVVDPEGRYKNLRDMHEMYNAGHLLEGALAHHHYTESRQFLDVMIRYVECFMKAFGSGKDQLHGYPGHPELELAVLRLYNLTHDPRHLEFGRYLLEARGVKREEYGGETYFVHEAEVRKDPITSFNLSSTKDMAYNQSHLPIHDQDAILGHSVRAFYLYTACADLGGGFLEDAKRLLTDAVDNKMYVTGGFGTEPAWEGFSHIPHRLPQSTGEGGCYAETCASIACMMTSERILSHGLDGKVRDVMELCLLNAVLGGGSLDGKQFSYANKLATWGDEVATRKDWFEVCCCPPNLSRTLGMIGGYTWSAKVDEASKIISLNVYLHLSATREIELPDGKTAKVSMESGMPWVGEANWKLEAPEGWTWKVSVPCPDYAEDVKVSAKSTSETPGFLVITLPATSSFSQTFSLPVRLLSPHPLTGQDTLNVTRGPIVYTAESFDNESIDSAHPHFEGVGISSKTTFAENSTVIGGIPVIMLEANEQAYSLNEVKDEQAYSVVTGNRPRTWTGLGDKIRFTPWFARANRGGAGRVRTAFLRADEI
ncbi:hypothetical protein IAR55_002600 [Kwoniella newhampshirensis]|uniref:DUF1680 domain protein n=1 Tax=Kwoniella newhampshirensis TaxID=1651941 RepID=A0AAW0Z1W2_9TREE